MTTASNCQDGETNAPRPIVARENRTLVIEMPLPDVLLSLNRRLHWRQRARLVREQREAATLCAYVALSAARDTLRGVYFPEGRVTVDITVYRRPAQKVMDDGGLIEAAKSWLDGCEDAGVVSDDKQFRIGTIVWYPTDPAPRIVLTMRQETEG